LDQSVSHKATTTTDATVPESRTFEADVAKLLYLMVHSVYSDKDVFLRELISNAADACERLRYEAIANPALLDDDPKPRITIQLDPENRRLTVEDNGIGMSRDEMVEGLGTIARSGTKAFIERFEAARTDEAKSGESAQFIGQFGVGFYSTFMVANRVDVISRRAGVAEASIWSSDGKGSFTIAPIDPAEAPRRGTRVVLLLMEDAQTYTERHRVEHVVKSQSGHVPVPIAIFDKPDGEPAEIADGAALWTKSKSDVKAEDYTDFYRSVAGQFDEPALTVHFRAEGRHEYTTLAFVPGSKPFDLSDRERKGRIKLYVKRVFITEEVELLPRYLRFVRGLVDSADLPLNVSREMIQESPVFGAIKKGVANRILQELTKLSESDPAKYGEVWLNFGAVLKEGLYEGVEKRDALYQLARFASSTHPDGGRTLRDYVAGLRENQTAIYYLLGDDLKRLAASPQLEGFSARGVEVLLLPDPVDAFWVATAVGFDGKPFKSVTQGAADIKSIPLLDTSADKPQPANLATLFALMKQTLEGAVEEVRASDRLAQSPACLIAPDRGPDRRLEQLLAEHGQLGAATKPILEVNPKHPLIEALAALIGSPDKQKIEDITWLIFDEARLMEGEKPASAPEFATRLTRVLLEAAGRPAA
jgi:molecular chaperone HtpG